MGKGCRGNGQIGIVVASLVITMKNSSKLEGKIGRQKNECPRVVLYVTCKLTRSVPWAASGECLSKEGRGTDKFLIPDAHVFVSPRALQPDRV